MAELVNIYALICHVKSAEEALGKVRRALEGNPGASIETWCSVGKRKWTDLDLDTRTKNVVEAEIGRDGTIGDILQRREGEWLRCPNMGRKSLAELKFALAEFHVALTP